MYLLQQWMSWVQLLASYSTTCRSNVPLTLSYSQQVSVGSVDPVSMSCCCWVGPCQVGVPSQSYRLLAQLGCPAAACE
jgi:hypothetical protein